jgi:branched-chain amino acid transport system substrate-binding protein
MKNKTLFWLSKIFILLSVFLFVNGCKQEEQIATNQIKIGVMLGFSGTGSQNAIETKAALDICVEDVNAYIQRNGLDAKVELYYEDTKSDTTEAKMKARTLIEKGVSLIIGPYTSSEAKAVKSIVNASDVLLVSHSAVSTTLAIPDDNLLRFVPCDTYQAEAVNAMFTADTIEAIIPVVRNDLWSNSLIEATISDFGNHGGIIVSPQSFEPGTTDFSSLVTTLKSTIAEASALYGNDKIAVYLISYSDGTGFLEAMGNVGLTENIRVYGASAFAQSTALTDNEPAAEFAVEAKLQCPVFGFDEAASNIYEPIQARISNEIGSKASIYALAAYDILWTTVMTSLTQKQQPDFESFKAHFIETAGDYYGATGRTELDENGDRKHVFYDFWTIKKENDAYLWQLSAKYNTTDQLLRRF